MKTFYETTHFQPGNTFPTITAHDTYENAVIFANENNIDFISQNGGNYGEFFRCMICNEFYAGDQFPNGEFCERCERTLNEHL